MKKILITFILLTLCAVLLIGCTNPTDEPLQSPSNSISHETTIPPEIPPEKVVSEPLRIAIITSPTRANDGSFNQNNYSGVTSFLENHPNAIAASVSEPNISLSVQAVESIVADYNVLIAPGFQFAGVGQIALDNPDKKFILMDVHPTDSEGNIIEVSNTIAIQYRVNEGGFLAGVAAALESKTKKVATLGGRAYPSNVDYQLGFEAGVNYANEHLGTKVEMIAFESYSGTDITGTDIGGNYTGSFDDVSQATLISNALFKEDVDIIFPFAGNTINGVLKAAKEHDGVFVIGANVDQFDLGINGDNNVILTSIINQMGADVKRALETIADGTFVGGNWVVGIDTDSVGYESNPGRHQLSDSTIAELEHIISMMKNGTIVPPSNFSDTSPVDFPGL